MPVSRPSRRLRDADRAALCDGKDQLSAAVAQRIVNRWRAKHARSGNAYRCQVCGAWHVANAIKPRRKPK